MWLASGTVRSTWPIPPTICHRHFTEEKNHNVITPQSKFNFKPRKTSYLSSVELLSNTSFAKSNA